MDRERAVWPRAVGSESGRAMIRSLKSVETSPMSRIIFWFAVVIIGAMGVQHIVALMIATGGDGQRLGLDYRVFVAAGELIRSGNSDSIYQPNSPVFQAVGPAAFVYPPWAALFMVPWSMLPVGIGLVAWTVVGLGVMVVGLRACGVRDWRPLVLTMASFPALFALGLGQSSFLFVGLVAFAVAAMGRHRITRSGVYVALAAWKPHLLGGFGVLWLTDPRRWWRQAVGAVATTAILVVISAIALPGSWRAWISILTNRVSNDASAVLEASLPSMVSFLTGSSGAVRWMLVGVPAIALLAVAIAAMRRRVASLETMLALAFGTWLLIAPHVLVYDVLILVVPLSLAFQTQFRRDVMVSGTLLLLGLSIGPVLVQTQVDAWGRALNVSTLSLIVAVAVFLYWAWFGKPFFVCNVAGDDALPPPGCENSDAL